MNATKWPSLTEFAKYLGREGICRVEDDDKGLHIAWVDNSPEALRRQDAIRKKERQDKGDEEREQLLIREQVKRAEAEADMGGKAGDEIDDAERELRREGDEKIKLNFGAKGGLSKTESSSAATAAKNEPASASPSSESKVLDGSESKAPLEKPVEPPAAAEPSAAPGKVSMKMGFSSKPKNVFASAKKNALGGKKAVVIEQPKKMSEAERIMKEELERKRQRGPSGFGGPAQKKQRF